MVGSRYVLIRVRRYVLLIIRVRRGGCSCLDRRWLFLAVDPSWHVKAAQHFRSWLFRLQRISNLPHVAAYRMYSVLEPLDSRCT